MCCDVLCGCVCGDSHQPGLTAHHGRLSFEVCMRYPEWCTVQPIPQDMIGHYHAGLQVWSELKYTKYVATHQEHANKLFHPVKAWPRGKKAKRRFAQLY